VPKAEGADEALLDGMRHLLPADKRGSQLVRHSSLVELPADAIKQGEKGSKAAPRSSL
jgi:hypothetical protein